MRTWLFGDNVTTDAMAPGAYMKYGIAEIAKHCFESSRPEFAREVKEGDVVVAGPGDTLDTAFKRMKGADVSQLPIIEDGRLVGILDESDLIRIMNTDEITRKERFAKPVASAMTRDLDTLQVKEPLDALIPVFDRDRVAIVLDGEKFVGLITRTDLINHLSLNR